MTLRILTLSLLSVLLLASCTYISQGFFAGDHRGGITTETDIFGDHAEKIIYPEQNWDNADSLWFYNTTQGSNLMPFELFLHLEQTNSTALFRDTQNMQKFRYLAQEPTADNEFGLPVGWVKDHYLGQDYVGLTCAACHTTQVNYQGNGIRIDGGPAMADMESMMLALEQALQSTLKNEEKIKRLAKALAPKQTLSQVKDSVAQTQQKIKTYNTINTPHNNATTVHYGYGRLDAFGRIYNRLLSHLTPNQENFNPPNAPVSYPFLWDTPQHDFVQWNGVADNWGEGPLGRNTGEVLGVFASFDLNKHKHDLGYKASADIRNLTRLELHLKDLWSPSWQELAEREVLPAINEALAQQGKQVFVEYQCHTCHEAIDRTDPKRRVIAQMASLPLLQTDPQMAHNAFAYAGLSGYFEGKFVNPAKLDGKRFGETTKVLPALSLAVAKVILEPDPDTHILIRWAENGYDLIAALFDNPVLKTQKHLDFEIVDKNNLETLLAYKGRPLNGIWATAPYLHNGSVPNLYQLFLPACHAESTTTCRDKTFTVGNREIDPVNVGFVQKNITEHPELFLFDTSLPGNSNKGHEYAAGITPVIKLDPQGRPLKDSTGKFITETLPPMAHNDRLALVEYLKTL